MNFGFGARLASGSVHALSVCMYVNVVCMYKCVCSHRRESN